MEAIQRVNLDKREPPDLRNAQFKIQPRMELAGVKGGGRGDRRQRHCETYRVPPTRSQDGRSRRRVCPIIESGHGASLANYEGVGFEPKAGG
jgi:hypothetical protein